jgi:anti-sigma factor RsiW
MKAKRARRLGTWARTLRRPRLHPAPATLSRYLDSDLSPVKRDAVARHVAECVACRHRLSSLRQTIGELRSLPTRAPSRLPETIVAALPRTAGERGGAHPGIDRLRAALRYCLKGSQLRITAPVAVLVGAALSLANQGATLFRGEIDLSSCAACSLDFMLPFVALNVVLVAATRRASRR